MKKKTLESASVDDEMASVEMLTMINEVSRFWANLVISCSIPCTHRVTAVNKPLIVLALQEDDCWSRDGGKDER